MITQDEQKSRKRKYDELWLPIEYKSATYFNAYLTFYCIYLYRLLDTLCFIKFC